MSMPENGRPPRAGPERPPILSRVTFSVALHSAALGLIVAAAHLSVGPSRLEPRNLAPYTLREPVIAPAPQRPDATQAVSRPSPGDAARAPRQQPPAKPEAAPAHGEEPTAAASSSGDVTEGFLPPTALSKVDPVYPEPALQAGAEGEVELEVIVTPRGRIAGIDVVGSDPLFDDAAVEAVSQWRFAPALQDGHPVGASMRVVVVFKLA